MSSQHDLAAIQAFAEELALQAGKLIRDGQARRFAESSGTKEKLNSVDLVTEVDQAVEAFLIKSIQEKYPEHKFIGEETYDGQQIGDEPTWICDPIDGTTNFVHGFPFVACSIGVTISRTPVVGVIYNPFLDQLYSARTGAGAYLNKTTRLPLAQTPQPLASLGTALCGVEWGSSRTSPAIDKKATLYKALAGDPKDVEGGKLAHSLRSLGSAALNICLVASGGLDTYHEIGCWPWDVCAGIVILQEAGGAAFGAKGTPMTNKVGADLLQGRKYFFVRGLPDGQSETAFEAQVRFAKEYLDLVNEWDQ